MSKQIPVGVSNRHIHVTEEVLHALFGEGHTLTSKKELSQPGEFAAEEVVTARGPKGEIKKIRILGPTRHITQLEISRTDSFVLGIAAPVRMSGDIAGSAGVTLIGPAGEIEIKEGAIVAKRHVHMTPEDAKTYGVKNGDTVMLKTGGERAVIFDEVVVRVSETFKLDFHIDTDEANASNLKTGDSVELVSSRQYQTV